MLTPDFHSDPLIQCDHDDIYLLLFFTISNPRLLHYSYPNHIVSLFLYYLYLITGDDDEENESQNESSDGDDDDDDNDNDDDNDGDDEGEDDN